ncbi:MAG: DNA primase [Deltaproteobacteria bacterium]|nr:DNA primase [Deltaproteobacteria bacterium]
MIPEEKVREVAERISIVDVVSEYVQLRRSGGNFLGLCPFHGEKTPSFNVNPAREIFHCFGCGAGGNAFSFVMKMEGLSFPEAVKLLARKSGIEIEERQLTQAEKQSQDERHTFQRINELTTGFYRSVLSQKPEGAVAREYLERRAATGEIAEAYRLGFAPDRSDGLVQHLRANGINLESALKLGIVRKSERGWYDQFRNRLMFPIRDTKGNVIAFAGRVLDNSLPKYINSPESPLYHKSSVLFGLDMALPTIRTENSVIIVEGYFDHLALFRAGIRNVVATCGTALTATHAALIKRHAEKVYTLFDSDNAGKKATIKSMELFLEQRMPAYVITLPAGDDPDSFLSKHPANVFNEYRDKARPIFDFFVRSLLQETPPNSVNNKVKVIDELAQSFKKISSSAEKSLYGKEICRLLDIRAHEFQKQLQLSGSSPTKTHETPVPVHTGSRQVTDRSQEMLLGLMANFTEAVEAIREQGVDTLLDGDYLSLAKIILKETENAGSPDWGSLMIQLEKQELRDMLSRLLFSASQFEGMDWRTAFDDCKQSRAKKQISTKNISLRLAVIDPDSEEHAALLRQASEEIRTRKSKL